MVWGNDKGAAINLIDYMSDIDSIISHLNAARSIAVSLYQHNPDSRDVPNFEGLYDDFAAKCMKLRAAKKAAKDQLEKL